MDPDTSRLGGQLGSEATVDLTVDGRPVSVPAASGTLLDVLREHLGIRAVKDGCAPQGQCGCCTVLVDGAPRVACVTPIRRVAGRNVTTVDGLEPETRQRWGDALCDTGGSQCGFCTPGIVMRLEGLRAKGTPAGDVAAVERALQAHLCRCTGWRTIVDAWEVVAGPHPSTPASGAGAPGSERDLDAAGRRATLEGHAHQRVHPTVALGAGGFADDSVPPGTLVALPDRSGGWAVGESLAEARAAAGKVQGRNTTVAAVPPLALPDGDWVVALRTSWVEPGYLEPDASWCEPGGEPASPLGNGGAFGGKVNSPAAAAARQLADRFGRPVRVLLSREDVVRLGPKRPPLSAGVRGDGTGVVHVRRTPGIAAAIASVAPGLRTHEVELAGPPTSADLRAAGWAEAAVLLSAASGNPVVKAPNGSEAEAWLEDDGRIHVRVRCGDPLDEVVLRSYCTGAAHMALGWVRSEGLAVDGSGEVLDLTIRSFGILRAVDTPAIEVEVDVSGPTEPTHGSDAVFAAVAAAAWRADGHPSDWPTGRPGRR